jgi:hypothetical protein
MEYRYGNQLDLEQVSEFYRASTRERAGARLVSEPASTAGTTGVGTMPWSTSCLPDADVVMTGRAAALAWLAGDEPPRGGSTED